MSTQSGDGVDRALLEQIIVDSGVKVTAEDVESVARSLARIHKAMCILLPSLSFDTGVERFSTLIESDVVPESAV